MQNQSTAIWVSHLCCVSSGGGNRSRSRRAATPCPTIPRDGLAWAEQNTVTQKHCYWSWAGCAGEELQTTTTIISVLIALFDHTDRAQNVTIITGTPWEHLWFSLHEITSFAVLSEKHSMRIIRQIRFECCCFVERGWRHGFRELLCCPELGINGRAPHLSLILPSWLPRPMSEFGSFWFLPHPSWLGPK